MLPLAIEMEARNANAKLASKLVLRRAVRKGMMRVYFGQDETFKTLNVDENITTEQLIQLALSKLYIPGPAASYDLYEVFHDAQKRLKPDDRPYLLRMDWESKKLENLVKYVIREKTASHHETMVNQREPFSPVIDRA